MIVLWFDPGLLTGVTAYDLTNDKLILCDEFDYIHTGGTLDLDIASPISSFVETMLAIDTSATWVGWESYRIMKGAQSQAPWSLEVIGMLKYLCAREGYSVLPEAAPSDRNVCTPAMLKAMGWYDHCKGKKDALSSAQHMVAWMLRENKLPDKYKEAIYGPLR